MSQADGTSPVDRRMVLAHEWDRLVEEVHKRGFKDFLSPPSLETLLPAAAGGPVAVINLSVWRCDALIITTAGVRTVELQDLTLEQTVERVTLYLNTLEEAERAAYAYQLVDQATGTDPGRVAIRDRTRAAAALMKSRQRTDDMLRSLQEWLWDSITAPVLGELKLDRVPPPGAAWPRLWWCPTGPLAMLPLHTAGYHHESGGDVPRTVIDCVVSSYTPTLRALLEARTHRRGIEPAAGPPVHDGQMDAQGELERDRLLIVTLEELPGQVRLRGATEERDALIRLVPEERRTLLDADEATWANVRRELPKHRWVHFSCHGGQDLRQPSRGGLFLHDRVLSIADISAQRFAGDFAGLAACKTATGGISLVDEAISLSAALHYTGYRHVVAALWSIDDETSAKVFNAVYEDIVVDGALRPDGAAQALHTIVRALRTEDPHQPSLWTPFTHTGP
ncbi:CHAT domain-containing protein [Streptomyces sp. NPDC093568]|uniref:CHAT domain-containing protein n=1 Tax=Streptomyces sp. NPDC093568 TaxID=3366041 RepID=UPI0038102473